MAEKPHNNNAMTVETKQKTKKTWVEIQPYLFAYGFGISLFSPTASVYQLAKLNPKVNLSMGGAVKLALRILPHQTLLKAVQMNISTPVREQLNPWAAFALVGILQGGVYGQANIFFARELKIGAKLSYAGLFRGFGFAGGRDMLSQGVPYVFSAKVEHNILDKVYDTSKNPSGAQVKRWTAVLGTSVVATYMSQGLHNCQIIMHANQGLSHLGALQKGWSENKISLFYKGAEARVGLLLIVNILNELILKKAWEK